MVSGSERPIRVRDDAERRHGLARRRSFPPCGPSWSMGQATPPAHFFVQFLPPREKLAYTKGSACHAENRAKTGVVHSFECSPKQRRATPPCPIPVPFGPLHERGQYSSSSCPLVDRIHFPHLLFPHLPAVHFPVIILIPVQSICFLLFALPPRAQQRLSLPPNTASRQKGAPW